MFKISIKDNISEIENRIKETLAKKNRFDDVTLIAVSKTQPVEKIQEVLDLNHLDMGENKVQELMDKMAILGDIPRYHMIGHLQTNKVKYIADKIHLIHSLDRISLAKEINKRAKASNRLIDCLVQVNIAKEDTKYGLYKDDVIPFIEQLLTFEHIKVKGLMTIAPFTEDEKVLRETFRGLYNLKEDIIKRGYGEISMDVLSMGMTNDYEIAIEEGSNMIRVGTGIFGKRNY